MHLAIMGDCVAWNPDIAPHATVMNMNGHIGRLSGWRFSKEISGIVYCGRNTIAPAMLTAITIRMTPNMG